MKAYIRIEYSEEEKKYRGDTFIKYPFEYDPKKYREELIEEVKRILNEYPGIISFNFDIH
jgi:hypothetical protein